MAVKITRETADARRHLWVEAPMGAAIDGIEHTVRHWSISGLILEPNTLATRIGATHAVRVAVALHGIDMAFSTDAIVEPDTVASQSGATTSGMSTGHVLRFTSLTQAERELLGAVVDSVTGASAEQDGAGQTLATVPSLPSIAAQPLAFAPPPAPRRGWYNSTIGFGYTVASLAVIGYLCTLGFQQLKWQEASNAVMAAPTVQLVAQGEGHIEHARLRPGDAVKPGDLIAKVNDNALERDIELATLAVTDREARYAHAKKTSLIRATIDLARVEVDVAKGRRDTLVRHRERLILRSPIDGVLADLNQQDRMGVRRGDVIAEIQAPADGTVTAFLTGAEAQRLQPEGVARIKMPGGSSSFTGRIVKIEPIPPQPVRVTRAAPPPPKGRVENTVRVIVALDDPSIVQHAPGLRSGDPVVVMLEKASGRYWSERLGAGATSALDTARSLWADAATHASEFFKPRDVVAADSKRRSE